MIDEDKSSEGKTKNITLGLVLSWVVGVLLIIVGIGFAVSSIIVGLLVLLGGLIMLPPVSDFIKKKFHVHLSGGVRFVIALVLFVIGVSMITSDAVNRAASGGVESGTQAVDSGVPAAGSEKLELVSFKCSTEYGFSKVTGEVKNISGKSMDSVVAVGSFYTKSGEFVKSSDAIIDYNPILAGQTSPFQVITTSNPEMDSCKIAFKEFFGGTIPTKRASE